MRAVFQFLFVGDVRLVNGGAVAGQTMPPARRKLGYRQNIPLVWTCDGAGLDLYAESQEPYMASVVKKRREEAEQSFDSAHAKRRKKSFAKFDFTALVIEEGLRTPAQAISFVQRKGSTAMQAFVNKHQRHLKEFLKHSWEWASAHEAESVEEYSEAGMRITHVHPQYVFGLYDAVTLHRRLLSTVFVRKREACKNKAETNVSTQWRS
jgi:hypothetical protein